MSNLGWYQLITTAAKKVGGPKVLLALVAAGGYVVLRPVEAGVKKVVKNVKKPSFRKIDKKTYAFLKDGKDGAGFEFKKGEQFTVEAEHDDSILIERLNDENNPYFVSASLLKKVSDYGLES
ncbi:hypothetical protein K8A91_08540 [Listeria monocytogenes]|nr:hypothetical protein [Listeria monocytogenes]EJD3195424.1 hypothetical protein [Listeria monocytogenes]EJD3240066.1 hypothetical protein [Listeria monocytogenes]MCD1849277.1 hypothetical protein [Listeria monocytogenes]MCD1852218.1 hypothetical protein [Listeria monocytogenes]